MKQNTMFIPKSNRYSFSILIKIYAYRYITFSVKIWVIILQSVYSYSTCHNWKHGLFKKRAYFYMFWKSWHNFLVYSYQFLEHFFMQFVLVRVSRVAFCVCSEGKRILNGSALIQIKSLDKYAANLRSTLRWKTYLIKILR